MSSKKKIEEKKTVKAINKNVRSSTRKLKPILKSIVGKKVDVAMRDLTFSEKRISKDVKKTISSAVANAENNYQYDIDRLIVKEAFCCKQIVMKRFRARAKGRAAPILKPYSNVTIILSEKVRSLNAISTFFPTIPFRIGFNFLTLDLTFLLIDFTNLSLLISFFFLLILFTIFLVSWCCCFSFLSCFFIGWCMSSKCSCWSKFT